MPIDVTAETTINRPRDQVAAFMEDYTNDLRWIRALTSVEAVTGGPLTTGTKVRRVAKMMGRSMAYVTEVVAYEPQRKVEMVTSESPFPMHVTYSLDDAANGATRVRIRNQGGPGWMFGVIGKLMGRMVNRNVQGDLDQLKWVLES